MVKHIVMFNFKDLDGKTAKEHAEVVKEGLLSLVGKVPSLRSMEVGLNVVDSNGAQDLVLIGIFDDLEGLKEYDVHPEHVKVGDYIRATGKDRHAVDFFF